MLNVRCLLAVTFIALFTLSCQVENTATRVTPQPPPSGFELFKQKCSKCHGLERALRATKSKEAWLATISRMREEHQASLSGQEIEQLVKYHTERQKHEAAVFKEQCQRCHPGKIFLEKNMTPQQTRTLIRCMQEKAGNTIGEEDVEMIINYHKREHQKAVQSNLRTAFGLKPEKDNPEIIAAMVLFMDKCSDCHEPDIALNVLKDERVWKKTIKRMQDYSQGRITDTDAEELVNFHLNRQNLEIETFRNTCTACHGDERIINRTMTSEEWIATIKRMQQKAPELITDEKIQILASYFHRREMVMASIFYGNCDLCHTITDTFDTNLSPSAISTLIKLTDEKFIDNVSHPALQALLSDHAKRERREMDIFAVRCSACHEQDETGSIKKQGNRSRAEWAMFIATLADKIYTDELGAAIDTQINYHVIKQKKR
jgi:mono/diheme cytochrome c family protein